VRHLLVVHPSFNSLVLDHFPFLLVVPVEVLTFIVGVELTLEVDPGSCPLAEERTKLEVPDDLEEVLTVEANSSEGFLGNLMVVPTSILPLVEAASSHP